MDIEQILKEQRDRYRHNFLEHGDSPRGTFQNSLVTMHLRYERLLAGFDLGGSPSILDVGCGLGDLHGYLRECGVGHEYYGSEIVPEMVRACQAKYPGIRVDGTTVFQLPEASFDFVVLSGALNLRFDTELEAWKSYAMSIVEQMFRVCRKGVAFNFLTTCNDFQDPELVYFDPSLVLQRAFKMSRFVSLEHAYPLYECTVRIATKAEIRRQYSEPELARYLK